MTFGKLDLNNPCPCEKNVAFNYCPVAFMELLFYSECIIGLHLNSLFGLLVGGGVREELPEKRSANMKKSQKGT